MADLLPNPTLRAPAPNPRTASQVQHTAPNPQIVLRTPSAYAQKQTSANGEGDVKAWAPPPLSWLEGTWTVTHSTLPMWRKAKNVRITYKLLPPSSSISTNPSQPTSPTGPTLLDDEVSSVPTEKTWMPQPKSIRGVDTPDPNVEGAWNWRGRGWLKVATARWEVLGWGEGEGVDEEKERWVVTWFAASMFTPMGVDVYSSRKEGISEGLYERIEKVLGGGGAGSEVASMCRAEMRGVAIDDA